MNRRQLLARFGAVLGTASLGGCLSRYRDVAGEAGDGDETEGEETTTDGGGETTTDDGGETTTDDAGGTATNDAVADRTFDMTDRGCAEPTSEASVEFDAADNSVAVTGTIGGSDACHVAELANASHDPETGTFDVTVVSTPEEGAQACAQCLVAIDYEATFTFEESLPVTVTVTHEAMGESKTVAEAQSN